MAAKLGPVGRFYSRAELVEERRRWKAAGKAVVFTNGCYDLLHPGHIRLLERCRSMGDVLILALNSDAGARRMKGPSRPLLGEGERAEVALALDAVDAVTLFDEETPRELIAEVLPDVLVKGGDYDMDVLPESAIVRGWGGKALAIPFEHDRSTTALLKKVRTQG